MAQTKDAELEFMMKILMYAAIGVFAVIGGFSSAGKFFQRKISHDKLTTVRYQGEWSQQEYRDCDSLNMKTDDKEPELYCGEATLARSGKVFNVEFSGDITYDAEKTEGEVHYWRCRRNNSDPAFSCTVKETSPKQYGTPSTPSTSTPSTSPPPPAEGRQLTGSEIDNLRKRNECEQRFHDKKIYEVDGMSIYTTCKQNPLRMP